jgi:hypothetical protein
VVRKAAQLQVGERGALLCNKDVAYSESFYGVSLKGAKSADDLAAYFYVLSYSSLFVYFQLMTSSKFGVERDTFHKEDYENFPVRYWTEISPENQREVRRVASAISEGLEPWADVDAVVEKIYGLSRADTQLISDAMEFSMPHSKKVNAAAAKPTKDEVKSFLDEVSTLLKAFMGEKGIVVRREEEFSSKSFEFFSVAHSNEGLDKSSAVSLQSITEILSAPLFASHVRIKLGPNQWLIGQLAQRRYWSKTRARILALEWLDGGFVGQGQVQ